MSEGGLIMIGPIDNVKPIDVRPLGLIGLVLLLTGCIGVTGNSESLHPTAAMIEESGRVEWVVDSDLSRDDVGMIDGRDSAIYDSLGRGEPYQVRLTLPDGTTIEESVKFVSAFTGSDGGPPCLISFSHWQTMSAEEAEITLAEYQRRFDLDGDEVAQWRDRYDELTTDGYEGGQSAVVRLWGPPIGDVQPIVITHIDRIEGTVTFNVDLNRCE